MLDKIKQKAGRCKLFQHPQTEMYYISDGLYLSYWSEVLQDWDDSDYKEDDEFFDELVEVK